MIFPAHRNICFPVGLHCECCISITHVPTYIISHPLPPPSQPCSVMTWLPFLQDEGYLPTDPSTGYLRQMPLALQHTISTAMLEHLSSDAARVIKATVRSQSDLMYLMETIGVAFGFSTSEYAASVKKAMDVYLLLFTPPLATQLRLFEDQSIKEACLLHALKQLSLGLEVRHDFP